MFVWIQIIFFIITNAPAMIRAIQEIIELLRGDRQKGKKLLKELKLAKKQAPKSVWGREKAIERVVENWKASESK